MGKSPILEWFEDEVLDDGTYPDADIWHKDPRIRRAGNNHVFHDRLRCLNHTTVCGALGVWLRSETTGRRYYMFMLDFINMVANGDVVSGVIEDDWVGVKKGRSFAVFPKRLLD